MQKQKTSMFRYRAENSPKAWLFLLPALVIVAIFNIYPLFRSFVMAFQKGRINRMSFAGIENFQIVLADPKFHRALVNTSIFAFFVVPISLIISMLIAITIYENIKGKDLFEGIFFVPYLTSIIAIGIVFRFLLNGDYGIVNYGFRLLHLPTIDFLEDPTKNMLAVVIFGIWSGLAFNIIILLSGLRNIDKSYFRVADMFGATKWEQFFRITLPQLMPIITFLLIVNFISAFKVYAQVFSLFNGKAGMADSATTAVFYIFNKFYNEQRFGQGMAAAVILFLLILVFTLIQNMVLRRISGGGRA